MEANNMLSRLYVANIIEENTLGFHRETLWYGGSVDSLALLIIDVMKDWYEPNIADLDKSIIDFHKMLEDKEGLTFNKLKGEAFNADGMRIHIDITNNLNDIFNFIIGEICSIYAKEGETLESFEGLADFKEHFLNKYDIDEEMKAVLEGVNEITISKALIVIDMKYNYTLRHFRAANVAEQ